MADPQLSSLLVGIDGRVLTIAVSGPTQTVRWLAVTAAQRAALLDAAAQRSMSSALRNAAAGVPASVVLEATGEVIAPTLSLELLCSRLARSPAAAAAAVAASTAGRADPDATSSSPPPPPLACGPARCDVRVVLAQDAHCVSAGLPGSGQDLMPGVRGVWQAAAFSASPLSRLHALNVAGAAKVQALAAASVERALRSREHARRVSGALLRLTALLQQPALQDEDVHGLTRVMSAPWPFVRLSVLQAAAEAAGTSLLLRRDEFLIKATLATHAPELLRVLRRFGEGGGVDAAAECEEGEEAFSLQQHEWMHLCQLLGLFPTLVSPGLAGTTFAHSGVVFHEEFSAVNAAASPHGGLANAAAHAHGHSDSAAQGHGHSHSGVAAHGLAGPATHGQDHAHTAAAPAPAPSMGLLEAVEALLVLAVAAFGHEIESKSATRATPPYCIQRLLDSQVLPLATRLVAGPLLRSLNDSSMRIWVRGEARLRRLRIVYSYYSSASAEAAEAILQHGLPASMQLAAGHHSSLAPPRAGMKLRQFATVLVHAGLAPPVLLGTAEQQQKDAASNKGRASPPLLTMQQVRTAYFAAQLLSDAASADGELAARDREDDPWQRLCFWEFFDAVARVGLIKFAPLAGFESDLQHPGPDEIALIDEALKRARDNAATHLANDPGAPPKLPEPVLTKGGRRRGGGQSAAAAAEEAAAAAVAAAVSASEAAHIAGLPVTKTRRGSIAFDHILSVSHGQTRRGSVVGLLPLPPPLQSPKDPASSAKQGSGVDDRGHGRGGGAYAGAPSHAATKHLSPPPVSRVPSHPVTFVQTSAEVRAAQLLSALGEIDPTRPSRDALNEVVRAFSQISLAAVSGLADHLNEAGPLVSPDVPAIVLRSNTAAACLKTAMGRTATMRPATVAAPGLEARPRFGLGATSDSTAADEPAAASEMDGLRTILSAEMPGLEADARLHAGFANLHAASPANSFHRDGRASLGGKDDVGDGSPTTTGMSPVLGKGFLDAQDVVHGRLPKAAFAFNVGGKHAAPSPKR